MKSNKHMTYTVIVAVRKVGAIGIFYPKTFTVEATSFETAKSQWWIEYSNNWEFHHWISIAGYGPTITELSEQNVENQTEEISC